MALPIYFMCLHAMRSPLFHFKLTAYILFCVSFSFTCAANCIYFCQIRFSIFEIARNLNDIFAALQHQVKC